MKKNLLSSILVLFSVVSGYSQGAPNGSFESWSGTTYDVLTNYTDQSSNIESLRRVGQITTTKVSDPYSGSYAVKMETKTNGVDTTFGYFIDGNPSGSNFLGGIPYTETPTGLIGHYKCDVPLGDSAIILLIFKKSGVAIGQPIVQYLYGTHTTYTTFFLPISLGMAPDTVIIAGASSNPFSSVPNFNGLPGSTLQLDSLSFTGVVSQPALMNGDFELWSTATYYLPDSWEIQGDSVQRSTDATDGIYSLILQVTNNNGGGGGNPANADQVTTGYFPKNSGPSGGTPYTVQNDSLIGYYKLIANGNDSASINVNTYSSGLQVGGNYMLFLDTPTYTRFALEINSSSAPDTMRIDISAAANWPIRSACIGSKLYIDQLYVKSSPLTTGIPVVIMSNDMVNVYPNPSKGLFNLIYDSNSDETVSLEIYNSLGQKLFTKRLNGQVEMRTQLDITSYGKGIYFMNAIQGSHISSTRMIVE